MSAGYISHGSSSEGGSDASARDCCCCDSGCSREGGASPTSADPRVSRLWLIVSPRRAAARALRRLQMRQQLLAAFNGGGAVVFQGGIGALTTLQALFEERFLPDELVRMVADFAAPSAKCAMERVCRQWRGCVTQASWTQALRAEFGVDYVRSVLSKSQHEVYLAQKRKRGRAGAGLGGPQLPDAKAVFAQHYRARAELLRASCAGLGRSSAGGGARVIRLRAPV